MRNFVMGIAIGPLLTNLDIVQKLIYTEIGFSFEYIIHEYLAIVIS